MSFESIVGTIVTESLKAGPVNGQGVDSFEPESGGFSPIEGSWRTRSLFSRLANAGSDFTPNLGPITALFERSVLEGGVKGSSLPDETTPFRHLD